MAHLKIASDMLHDPALQRLPAREFKRLLLAAADGQPSPFDAYVQVVPYDRLPAHEWAEIRTAVFARDHFTCQYCGARDAPLECDHVVPISRGGSNEMDNLVTACIACNRAKHDKTPEEWLS